MNNKIIFCDFDGTITKEDTVDKLLERYATDKWLYYEDMWLENKIGSKECLENQINCIEYFSNKNLEEFIETVKIDEEFVLFLQEIKKRNIEFYIVSDGFDLLINKILEKYGINNIKIFSNMLSLDNNELKTLFPFYSQSCKSGSGLCKCSVLKRTSMNKQIIYIGDGKSDFCVSKHADIIFAKHKLAEFCRNNNLHFHEFQNFNDITVKLLAMEDTSFAKNRIIAKNRNVN